MGSTRIGPVQWNFRVLSYYFRGRRLDDVVFAMLLRKWPQTL